MVVDVTGCLAKLYLMLLCICKINDKYSRLQMDTVLDAKNQKSSTGGLGIAIQLKISLIVYVT